MTSKYQPAVLIIFSLLFFQNCSKNAFVVRTTDELGIFKNSECLGNNGNDACIWIKNASANVATFTGNMNDYSNSQTVGVKFSKLGSSDILKNGEVDVTTVSGNRIKRNSGQINFLVPFEVSNPENFLQVNTYYWSEKTLSLFEKYLDSSPLAQKNTKVLVNSSLSGWSPAFNEIHLQARRDENKYMALDGSLIAYNVSQAAISTLNQQQELTTHDTVGNCRSLGGHFFVGQCCTTQNGCIEAIVSGQADFIVSLLFPNKPALGEDWASSQKGLKNCSIYRDPSANVSLTANQAYTSCADRNISGYAPALGAVYASFWFELQKKATDKEQVLKLFFKHLSLTKGSDTFLSTMTKLKGLDQTLNQGALNSLIDQIATTKGFQ